MAAGLHVTNVVPSAFHLTSQQQAGAIEVTGEADGHFDPGDSILFYGQKLRGDILAARYAAEGNDWLTFSNGWRPTFNAQMIDLYSDENGYWLTTGGSSGTRIRTAAGRPSGAGWQRTAGIAGQPPGTVTACADAVSGRRRGRGGAGRLMTAWNGGRPVSRRRCGDGARRRRGRRVPARPAPANPARGPTAARSAARSSRPLPRPSAPRPRPGHSS